MTDLKRYLVEEVAVDYKDGIVTRREALHRLALLGVGAATATSMLAACGDAKTASTSDPSKAGSAPAPTGTPSGAPSVSPFSTTSATASSNVPPPFLPLSIKTEEITFVGPEGRKLQGAWASAEKPRGGILVIHENKGTSDHFRHVAGRFAAAGYSAMAIDLLSEEGGTASLGDPANATAALGKAKPERFVADMRAGLDEIQKRTPKVKLGAIGFCFGGACTWRLIGAKDPRLAAAAPFYGPLPDDADFAGAKTAVLGVFAELDTRVNASRDAAKAALEKAKLTHEIVTYPGADHAFFNDAGKRYNEPAAIEAWKKVLDWFGKYVG